MNATYWVGWAVITVVNVALLLFVTRAVRRNFALLGDCRDLIANPKADAWDEGYHTGVRDELLERERAGNPYRSLDTT